ncbi:helix-turn-helix domain-containing protein [Buttiauxella sp. A111]|uniref:helix-turn-helix domain-containing protein n=1 Tax=Buttiauxella sp. A111 TaxID=2563088 RepID=UPI0010F01400|nr:helix-turn-helix domain-containing protein [Buttiauxella sp. A111]GDX06054.1 hypothetical protein BSPA111_22620 [Buttiauxella sp. A111]
MGIINTENHETPFPSFYPPRPTVELDCVQKALWSQGKEQEFHPGEDIYAVKGDEKSIYLFTEGHFTFVRAKDGLVISSLRGGLVYGIAECLRPRGGFSLRVEEACKAIVVPAERAFEIFTQQQLWESVAHLMAWFVQNITLREEHLVGVSAYVMIRSKLLELHLQPSEFRAKTNVVDYIKDRTQLARSTIMAILSELRRGEYIEIKRGKLITIKYLPKDY